MMAAPLSYLVSAGDRADAVLPLTWFVLAIAVGVCLVIGYLLWKSVRRRPLAEGEGATVVRSSGGSRLVMIGLGLSSVLLVASLVWTMVALAQVAHIPRRPEVDIEITAHQWWWQAEYLGEAPSEQFSTANEIHVPVGARVRLTLNSSDVIHSFWVPRLTGKTDVIPGQTNVAWLEADEPGIYRGQCSEYCGLQHAHMGFEVVADTPTQFAEWRRAQLQTAPPPATPAEAEGLALVEYRCALCHTVRGTSAGSNVGPDLTHLMSRRKIAAGTLPNNLPSLAGWIEDPQGVKPGAQMPAQHLTGPQLQAVLAYLETLE